MPGVWRAFFPLIFLLCCTSGTGQTNSWTGAVSGNWEDMHWSLGVLPGTNQTVLFTNAGFKAVAIWSGTVQNHPETLNVESLIIASPTNSSNTLLLNYAGVQNPLRIGGSNLLGQLIVNQGSAVTVISSALQVQNAIVAGSPQGACSIGGTFNESDSSQFTAGFLRLGDIGPGIYNLTNSSLTVTYEFVGGGFLATFNHQSGTNTVTSLDLESYGEYDLFSGFFGGRINFRGGTFHQMGGVASADLQYLGGSYLLAGGTLSTPRLDIPSPPSSGSVWDGSFLQTGGTNFTGIISIGTLTSFSVGTGTYVLSNGVLSASGIIHIGPAGSFAQWGGLQTNAGLAVQGVMGRYDLMQPAFYTMGGGVILTPALNIDIASFDQSGGTNLVSGDVTLHGSYAVFNTYNLSGGRLADFNTTVDSSANGGFFQSGGIHIITNLLTVTHQASNFDGYVLSGGQLTAQNIQVDDGAVFHHTGGNLIHAGVLTLANGTWDEQTSGQQFGQLRLTVINATNSTLFLPTNAASVLHFVDSHNVTWSNQATLTIENWRGSISGGGQQQVIFGNSAGALSAQQLSQIQFHNPSGLAGIFPARILSTGEIVPERLLAFARSNHQFVLQWGGGWTLQSATNVAGPYLDVIGPTSPYTNNSSAPRRFFRLRR